LSAPENPLTIGKDDAFVLAPSVRNLVEDKNDGSDFTEGVTIHAGEEERTTIEGESRRSAPFDTETVDIADSMCGFIGRPAVDETTTSTEGVDDFVAEPAVGIKDRAAAEWATRGREN
jgi:hypothetical protein